MVTVLLQYSVKEQGYFIAEGADALTSEGIWGSERSNETYLCLHTIWQS